ncbi:hypothetical protein MHL40_16030 [Pseudomonas luteola]|uniref:hypothetical protein n=1 Tax=Pseudomonas luteola TaxID=47886 RepID=UPI001EF5EA50|nr:hypothetical protein [Pseudomonas luteola]MCG7374167.1 hypothetical protein [Pseudomonas luteola]
MTCVSKRSPESRSESTESLACLLKEALSIVPLHSIPDKRFSTWRMAARNALASSSPTYAIEVDMGVGLWMANDDPRRLQFTDKAELAFKFTLEAAQAVLESLDLGEADWSMSLVKYPKQ